MGDADQGGVNIKEGAFTAGYGVYEPNWQGVLGCD